MIIAILLLILLGYNLWRLFDISQKTHDSFCDGIWVGCYRVVEKSHDFLIYDDCKQIVIEQPICNRSSIVQEWEAENGN